MDLETRIEVLEQMARDRWGERWGIKTLHFSDGDHRAWAFSTMGLTDDGDHYEEHRIYVNDDGTEASVERVITEDHEKSREVIEEITPPVTA